MALTPYKLNYVAPQARDARRDAREQLADAAQDRDEQDRWDRWTGGWDDCPESCDPFLD